MLDYCPLKILSCSSHALCPIGTPSLKSGDPPLLHSQYQKARGNSQSHSITSNLYLEPTTSFTLNLLWIVPAGLSGCCCPVPCPGLFRLSWLSLPSKSSAFDSVLICSPDTFFIPSVSCQVKGLPSSDQSWLYSSITPSGQVSCWPITHDYRPCSALLARVAAALRAAWGLWLCLGHKIQVGFSFSFFFQSFLLSRDFFFFFSPSWFFFFFNFCLFILGCTGSLLLCGFFSSCDKWGLLLQYTVPSLRRLLLLLSSSCGSGLCCSAACGIFPDQGLNQCWLHWQANSYPMHHQESLSSLFLLAISSVN